MESAFPKPFCSLVPNTPVIQQFCDEFLVGAPILQLTISQGEVAAVEMVRGSPCGLTLFVAQKLVGLPADEALPEKAGQLHHAYPCLASMALDPETGDTIMHKSLFLLRDAVKAALDQATRR